MFSACLVQGKEIVPGKINERNSSDNWGKSNLVVWDGVTDEQTKDLYSNDKKSQGNVQGLFLQFSTNNRTDCLCSNLVRSHLQFPFPCFSVLYQQLVHHAEHLFHDSVLAQIVSTLHGHKFDTMSQTKRECGKTYRCQC